MSQPFDNSARPQVLEADGIRIVFGERQVLGSVSTSLVRMARCWVLIAPADESPA